jgi:hypothetical protein
MAVRARHETTSFSSCIAVRARHHIAAARARHITHHARARYSTHSARVSVPLLRLALALAQTLPRGLPGATCGLLPWRR